MFFAKLHEAGGISVLACADKELVGRNLVEGDFDVTIEGAFYGNEEIGHERLSELMREARSINLFGPRAVGVAVEQGFLTERDIIRIAGVEHAVILKI